MLTTNNILSQLPEFIASDPYVREILLADVPSAPT